LELGAGTEVTLPAFELTGTKGEEFDAYRLEDWEPTALVLAADWDDIPLARLLLEKGAKVQYSHESPWRYGEFSPMHAARSAAMVQLLLDYNADPNWGDENNLKPLHWYAIRDDLAAMREILQHGADAKMCAYLGGPLHEAAQRSLAGVKLLLDHGADVEKVERIFGNTPLHNAAKAGKLDVMKVRSRCLFGPVTNCIFLSFFFFVFYT
jgi:ankyrin repeat protein